MLLVFYSQNTRDTGMYGMVKDAEPRDRMRVRTMLACSNPENYKHVTTLETTDLDDAWETMQAECSELPRKLRTRSMMVGDILVNPETKELFVVDSAGFDLFDLADSEAFLARSEGK